MKLAAIIIASVGIAVAAYYVFVEVPISQRNTASAQREQARAAAYTECDMEIQHPGYPTDQSQRDEIAQCVDKRVPAK